MATIGEQQTWAAIASMARSLQQIAKIMEEAAEEFVRKHTPAAEEPVPDEDLPLTKAAWKADVAGNGTELGFNDWMEGRRG